VGRRMAHYHCYVLGPDRHINSRHDIEAADDAEAMLKASQVIALSEDVPTIEVWTGARLVGVLAQQNDSKGDLT
jgi:hypothetical protein